MQDKLYVSSIMRTVFTKDGDIVVIMNENQELDTLPQYFMGQREDNNYTGEGGIDILNDQNDYVDAVGYFFSSKNKYTLEGIRNGFLVGNKNCLIDCGELHPKIASAQIEEMKNIKMPSFIRIKRDTFEIMIEKQEVLNQIQTRYIVVPTLEIDEYQNIKMFSPEELEELQREGKVKFSPRLLWQMSGEELKEIKKFSNNLKGIITIVPSRKK